MPVKLRENKALLSIEAAVVGIFLPCNPIKAKLLLVSVNGERMPLNTELHDGDVVGFFSLVSGG